MSLPIDRCLDVPRKKYVNGPKNAVYIPHIGGRVVRSPNAIPKKQQYYTLQHQTNIDI